MAFGQSFSCLVDRRAGSRATGARTACRRASEQLLRAVEQAGAMEVLRELEVAASPLVRRQVGAVEQVLVHADRAVDLALAPEQAAQREVQVDRLRVDLDHLDERLDRLVGLLVQQEIEAAEIRQRQRARLAQQVLDVDARGDPAQREEHRGDRQQPPELEFHARGRGLGAASQGGGGAAQSRDRTAGASGRGPPPGRRRRGAAAAALLAAHPVQLALQPRRAHAPASSPPPRPPRRRPARRRRAAPASSSTWKNRSVTGSAFCSDRNSSARKSVTPKIQRTSCIMIRDRSGSGRRATTTQGGIAARAARRHCRGVGSALLR